MKTSIFNFKMAFMLTALLLTSAAVAAEGKNGRDMERTLNFFKTDTIVVVTPDDYNLTDSDKNDIEIYLFYTPCDSYPVYRYKSESDLSKRDNRKHLLLYGCLSDFKKSELLHLPIVKTEDGFKFRKQVYNQPDDAFFYINENSNRMYLCKNSNEKSHEFFRAGAGAYPMHIFRADEIVVTGVVY